MTRRILIVGAGLAGMWSALVAARFREQTSLADDAFEIVVVAPQPYLHIRPRLYEFDPSTMQVDLRPIFDAVNAEYVQGAVQNIAVNRNCTAVLTLDGSQSTLNFDRLVLASGSRLFRPEILGLAQHGFSVDQGGNPGGGRSGQDFRRLA